MNIIRFAYAVAAGALLGVGAAAQAQTSVQKTFASPEAAVAALRAAVAVHDKAALRDLFGPEVRDLLTGDEAQDKENSRKFAAAIDEGAKPVAESDGRVTLEIGSAKWPFPIPLVKTGGAWRFDTAAGKEEIVNRHIGKDELHAIGFCRSYRPDQKLRDEYIGSHPRSFHGYFFKTLPGQDAVPGGYALAAYPEHYGRSGVMTFIVDQDGKVYQRDFGAKTSRIAPALADYKPDDGWTLTTDAGVQEK